MSGGNLTWKVDQRQSLNYRLLNPSMADPLALKLEGRDPFFPAAVKKALIAVSIGTELPSKGREEFNALPDLQTRDGNPVWPVEPPSARSSRLTDRSFWSHSCRFY